MKAIVCEMCGSQDLVKKDGVYVCQNCGTKYDPEEAKKLMVEVSGTVKVDNTEKTENYYQLAKNAFQASNYSEAKKYYDLIKEENPNDWEAQFYSLISMVLLCNIGETSNAVTVLVNSFDGILMDVKANGAKEDAKVSYNGDACTEMFLTVSKLANAIHETGKGQWTVQPNVENPVGLQVYNNSINDATRMLCGLGDSINHVFGDEMVPFSMTSWKQAISIFGDVYNAKYFKKEISNEEQEKLASIAERIQHYEPEYKIPTNQSFDNGKKSGGCYVATAVYGSYDCPQVWTLRRYRDYTLAETWYGRAFIHTYYAISPTLVKWFGETEWFKNMWKPKLDRMVKRLNENGVADTPYQDRIW